MRFIPVRVKRPPQGTRALAVRVVLPGHDVYAPWVSPHLVYKGGVFKAFREKAHKDYRPEADAASITALVADGALLVRRSLAAPALAALVRDGIVALRPVALSSAVAGPRPALDKPVAEDDWALVDVLERFPLDRATLPPRCFDVSGTLAPQGGYDPSRPNASLIASRTDDLAWGEGRGPRAAAFRLHELPIDLFLREDVFARLNEALGGALEEGRSRPTLGMLDDTAEAPPFALSASAADEAAAAFYRLLAGSAGAGDRERALTSPIHAYLTALLVDRKAGDDTREAACAHPFYAAAYARDVDRGPRDDTRDAASGAPGSALEYVQYVDRGPHDRTRAAFKESYRAQDYEVLAARVLAAAKAVGEGPAPKGEVDKGGSKGGAGAAPKKGAQKGAQREEGPAFTPLLVTGAKRGQVVLTAPGAAGGELSHAADPGAAGVVAAEPTPKKGKALRSRIGGLVALGGSDLAPFVLRRDIAQSVLGHLPEDELVLRPVAVRDAEGAIDADFVWLDVRAEAPLDRDASDAVYSDPSRPHASFVKAVRAFVFDPARAPRAALFRVGELPNIVMIREDLLATLRKATGQAAATVKPPHDHLPMTPVFPIWAMEPAFEQSAEASAASASAYRALAAGEGGGKLRARALESPIYAYWVARNVDRGPSDDTRKSALGHPHYAALYARWVDHGRRADTESAAAGNAASALYYASHVAFELSPAGEKVLLASGWGPDDVRRIAVDLERVRSVRAAS